MINEYKQDKKGRGLKREASNLTYLSTRKKKIKLIDIDNYEKYIKPCSVLLTRLDEDRSVNHMQYPKSKVHQPCKQETHKSTRKNCMNIRDSDGSSAKELKNKSCKTFVNTQKDECRKIEVDVLKSLPLKTSHSVISVDDPCCSGFSADRASASAKKSSKVLENDIGNKEEYSVNNDIHYHKRETKLSCNKSVCIEPLSKKNGHVFRDNSNTTHNLKPCSVVVADCHVNSLGKDASYVENWFKDFLKYKDSLSDSEDEKSLESMYNYLKRRVDSIEKTDTMSSDSNESISSPDYDETLQRLISFVQNMKVSEDRNEDSHSQEIEDCNNEQLHNEDDKNIAIHSECVKVDNISNNKNVNNSDDEHVFNILHSNKKTIAETKKEMKNEENVKRSSKIFLPSNSEGRSSERTNALRNDSEKYIFKSRNKKKYIVNYFEYDDIKKMFVTVCLQEKPNSSENLTKCEQEAKTEPITISERLNSYGAFIAKKSEILSGIPTYSPDQAAENRTLLRNLLYLYFRSKKDIKSLDREEDSGFNNISRSNLNTGKFATSKSSDNSVKELIADHEKELECNSENEHQVESENELQSGNEHQVESENELKSGNEFSDESENEHQVESENEFSDESENEFLPESNKELITLSDSSFNSFIERSEYYCVHCFYNFLNNDDNYRHTCRGKREKGFLCIYCERIFPSYEKLKTHYKMHLYA